MAKHYQCKPSDLLKIEDDYAAYCVDEVAYFLEAEATDDKGRIRWDKIKWKDRKIKDNDEQIKFIQGLKRR